MTQLNPPIRCTTHGPGAAAFVCQHVAGTPGSVGFNISSTSKLARPDAWCDACDQRARHAGGWTSVARVELGATLICGACYDIIRARAARDARRSPRGSTPP